MRGDATFGDAGMGRSWRRWALLPALAAALSAPLAAEDAATGVADTRIQAEALAAEGDVARAQGRFAAAADAYRRALAIDGANMQARLGLAQVDDLDTGKPKPAIPAETDAVRAQLAIVDARTAIGDAELLARSGRHGEARAQLDRATALLAPLGDDPAARAERARVAALVAEAAAADAEAAQAAQRADRQDALTAAHIGRDVEAKHQQGELDERLARVADLDRRQDYEAALAQARTLVEAYPSDARTQRLYDDLLKKVHDQRAADLKDRDVWLRNEVHERVHRALIPDGFDGHPIFPTDWSARTEHRGLTSANAEIPAWQRQIEDRLAQRLTFRFDDTPLSDALRFLADQAGVNLIIDPQLVAEGDRTVTLAADGMRVDSALTWLAHLASTTWSISKQAVYVGTDPERQSVLQTYDVAPLVFVPRDQPGKEISFKAAGGKGGKGGGFDLFSTTPEQKGVAPEDFVDLLQNAVSPDTWKQEGNAIQLRATTLYITAPRGVHQLVSEFIRHETTRRNVVVHVEARWLEVQDGFFEEIGVNWGSANSLHRLVDGSRPLGLARVTGQDAVGASVNNRLPTPAVQGAAASGPTGLQLSLLRFGSTQVAAMLTAMELKHQGRILAQPSIATLNGVRGNVFVGQQVAYIHDYNVVNDNLDPVIQVLNVGASLDITPYVSADGKFVTMEFRPALATYQNFTDVIIAPRIIQQQLANGIVNIIQVPPITTTPFVSFPIDLPNVTLSEVSTTVTVPDRGSLLVGGFGHHVDQQAASKVPFLGHIPFLGRLFGQRGRYSDRSKLYLLATVHIINYDEAEASL